MIAPPPASSPLLASALRMTIGDAPACLLQSALDAPIPAGVKRHLLAEATARLLSGLATSTRFRHLFEGPGSIRNARHPILRSIAPLAEFPRDEFTQMLSEAVEFTTEYICRPRATIEARLAASEPDVTLGAVSLFFDRTADYGYFPRLIAELFHRRGCSALHAGEFRTLVAKIDEEVTRENGPAEMAQLMKPIFDLYVGRSSTQQDPIPREPLLQFLDDKGMTIVREYIERITDLRELQTISREELVQYLADLGIGVPRPDDRPPEPVAAIAESQSDPIPEEMSSPASDPLFLPDLRQMIGVKERQRFIKEVFRKDQAYFAGVIGTLNTFLTWPEAASYLQQVYSVNHLDPFNSEVVAFTDLVHRRFVDGRESG